MKDSEDDIEQHRRALIFIGRAQDYETQGKEELAITAYFLAGVEAVRGHLRDSTDLNVFPQIYAGLEGRMEKIYKDHELEEEAELSKRRGLRQG